VYSGKTGRLLFRIRGEHGNVAFGVFFVAGVGDTNGDGVPDIYVGDYASNNAGSAGGFAAVYSGVDGSRLHAWRGAAGEGLGPGRAAGDLNHDGRVDLIIGEYTSSDGAPQAGKVKVVSGATGRVLRTITSTTPNENLGFDAVGVGDTNGNGTIDYLVSAANLDTVYLIDGGPAGGCSPPPVSAPTSRRSARPPGQADRAAPARPRGRAGSRSHSRCPPA
jgi:hypothetical protein